MVRFLFLLFIPIFVLTYKIVLMTKGRLNLNLFILLFAFLSLAKPDSTAQSGPDLRIGYSNFPMLLYESSVPEYRNSGWMNYESYVHEELLQRISRYRYSYGPLITPGQFTVEYTHKGTRWIDWIASASVASAFGTMYDSRTSEKAGTYYLGIHSLLVGLRIKWVDKPAFQFYSGLAVGAALHVETFAAKGKGRLSDPVYTFSASGDITWLGMSVGRKFYAFAELTSGAIGLAQAGVGYRF